MTQTSCCTSISAAT